MKIVRGWKTPDISSSKKNEMLKEALFLLAMTVGSWALGTFLITDTHKGFGTMFLQIIGFCRSSASIMVGFVYLIAGAVLAISMIVHLIGFVMLAFTFKRLNWVLVLGLMLIFGILSDPKLKSTTKLYRTIYNPIPLYVGDKLEVYGYDRDKTDMRIFYEHSKCSP